MTACGVDLASWRRGAPVPRPGIPVAQDRGRGRPAADRRLPAGDPARDPARPVERQGHRHRRQRAGRAVLRARQLRGLFPPAAGHEPARCGQLHQPRHRQGRPPDREPRAARAPKSPRPRARTRPEQGRQEGFRARPVLRQPQPEGARRQGRPADRPRARGRPDDPDPLPPLEEQPALCRRSRRRQDRDRRRPRAQDRRGRRARSAAGRGDLLARHGRAARRHALSRRFRGAAEAGRLRAREAARGGAVHRRDPHRDRRRRDQRRGDGRLEPAQARALQRRDPLHRLDHLQGVPQPLREGPRAAAPVPEDRRQRADGRGHDQDPARAAHARSRSTTRSSTRPTRSRPRSSCRRATSTTASCPTRRST